MITIRRNVYNSIGAQIQLPFRSYSGIYQNNFNPYYSLNSCAIPDSLLNRNISIELSGCTLFYLKRTFDEWHFTVTLKTNKKSKFILGVI